MGFLKGPVEKYGGETSPACPTHLTCVAHFPDEKFVKILDQNGRLVGRLSPSVALDMVKLFNRRR